MDALPYIEIGLVAIPEDAPFTKDFVAESEGFSPDMTHKFDDQVDCLIDLVMDLLSSENKLKIWETLGKQSHEAAKMQEKTSASQKGEIKNSIADIASRLAQIIDPRLPEENALAFKLGIQI
jgi:hypothetical protein